MCPKTQKIQMLPEPTPYFADLQGPRRETENKPHSLTDSVMSALCAVLSGIEDWGRLPIQFIFCGRAYIARLPCTHTKE